MDTIRFMLLHFFTHKDFLPAAVLVPGKIFTSFQITAELLFLVAILAGVFWTIHHRQHMNKILTGLLITLLLWEVAIDAWDSLAGLQRGFDPAVSLPLYPCSIFLFTLPLVIWGKGLLRQMACGYICTLGLVGALINFLYPISRLTDYSCISFPAFHTFFYHGAMLFTALVLLGSRTHQLHQFPAWWTPLLASVPGLLVSIPANLVNYSPIPADYMYFTGQHPLSQSVFGQQPNPRFVTAIMYIVYLVGPVLFYFIPWAVASLLRRWNGGLIRK